MSAVEVIVAPERRSVHLGQDALFTCHARNVPEFVQFHWQVPSAIIDSGRLEDNDNTLRILDTTVADNNTDVSCLLFDQGNLLGTGRAELVVLPALPSTEPPTPASTPGITSKVGSTAKLLTTETEKLISTFSTSQEATTTPSSSSVSSTSTGHTSPVETTTLKFPIGVGATTGLPSKMPNGPHQGPTQSAIDGLKAGTVAPAVVGGLALFICILVTGFFLMRRHRRKSQDTDAEKGTSKHAELHMYEFITPGSLDFQDGRNSDEENHNKKRHGNNYSNQDSLRTYSRGTAPDSITRYVRAVPRRDRIVNAGGHGGKPRRAPVLTLSMNSLYEETTPTFVVVNPKNGHVGVLSHKPNGEAVEIVEREGPDGGEVDDEDQYVTLAQNPPMRDDNDSNEQNKLF